MTDENKRNDDSLIPIEIVDDFEKEAALLGHGKGQPRVVMVAIGAALLVGGYVAVGEFGDEATFGAAVAGVVTDTATHLQVFNECAFSGMPIDQLQTGADVQVAADAFGMRYGAGYAQRLRKCIPKIDKLTRTLEHTAVPSELATPLSDVADAAQAISDSWTSYRDYLEQGEFSEIAATARTEVIGDAHAALTQRLSDLADAAHAASGQ